ncbi:MAG TPA: hypothetical protein VFO86_01215 [Terriglobia bacterium]|nr:hypothetical protein [Terriglobia bacterium]
MAEQVLSQSIAAGASPKEIERVHGLYCVEVWAKDKPQFAPTLAKWILDHGWKYPPGSNGTNSDLKSKYQELSIPKPPED